MDSIDAIRIETYAHDIGQSSWLTPEEETVFLSWLNLDKHSRVLTVACGSGASTLRMASLTGCKAVGIDAQAQSVRTATREARRLGLAARATFARVDPGARLPYEGGSFDAVICIDAIDHFANRLRVLADWWRILKPGGHALFTDPSIIAGPITGEEMNARSSAGSFTFVPVGFNERSIAEAGFDLAWSEDVTATIAMEARRRHADRAARADQLGEAEGEAIYDFQQRFLQITERLAAERRMLRMVFLTERPESAR